MSFFERLLYIAYYGPARRPLRWLLRKWMAGQGRVAFGGLRGCEMLNQRLDCRLGIYELHVQDALTRYVAENDVVYDIGANFGFHTLLASRLVGNQGRVIAFEPLPENLESMKQFLSLNGCSNTLCRQEAISFTSGMVKFYASGSPAQASLRPAQGPAIEVASVTLDEVIKTTRLPDFVLMDIEGAEVGALDGAVGLLRGPQPPKMLIEVHGEQSFEQVKAKLVSASYSFIVVKPPLARRGLYPIHILAEKCGQPAGANSPFKK
jgi:FkbM family methyltransferase